MIKNYATVTCLIETTTHVEVKMHPQTKEDLVNFFKLCARWLARQITLSWRKYASIAVFMAVLAVAGVALYFGAKPSINDPVKGDTVRTALTALIITITLVAVFFNWALSKAGPANPHHQEHDIENIVADTLKEGISSPILVAEAIFAVGLITSCWFWLGSKTGGLAVVCFGAFLLSHINLAYVLIRKLHQARSHTLRSRRRKRKGAPILIAGAFFIF
jgi:hypothetical protein